ncbi:hypothetical protein HPP92_013939 [Vanilla planifolia]|uniref:RING-type domain-containing protein n=1 Tax=Vanilla planifolia TaxID=51239 RepID=A0A835UX54_VANPL|nr:hypothetical protein HPP92_013939 [Vanilla planifolia]
MAITLGILLFIITVSTLISFLCTRSGSQLLPSRIRRIPVAEETRDVERGIDEATLTTYPKVAYVEVMASPEQETMGACCSICLADYRASDVLRRLPECSHLFHVGCVDPWLRQHPTCPVCRTSPLPSPAATPMVVGVPPSGTGTA